MSRTVPDVSNNLPSRVLHIRSSPCSAPMTDPLAALSAGSSPEVDECGHVYLGLARALADENESIHAVVVCLDDLTKDEFELFTILSQRRRGALLYVYSQAPGNDRVAKAIALGATAQLTEQIVDQLSQAGATTVTPEHHRREPVDAAATRTATDEPAQPATGQPATDQIAADQRASESLGHAEQPPKIEVPPIVQERETAPPAVTNSAHDGAGETPDRPRVPWQSYENKPERQKPSSPSERAQPQPPMRAAPAKDEFDPSPPTRKRSYEPLLSSEEMQALMSDDISAIAPEPRESSSDDSTEFRTDSGGES